eukprot:CAMPEP_0113902308 /NCGR_PEP_ID=MMETSP0780_2-20120614/21773_1 /TAXON_ID=652834 /ORGANISM="Palpitomonas bilix" /LENGTH=171 /DNA_ID=CAMNT_0000895089 /DNA_START=31 /DNA_END=546 /DNA_ORIENTATION=- /assembly_acc=CAM_ASM_000599
MFRSSAQLARLAARTVGRTARTTAVNAAVRFAAASASRVATARFYCSHADFQPQSKVPENESDEQVQERIASYVKSDRIVLFMKGTPEMPQCGFSQAAVTVLGFHNLKYASYDVLSDLALRAGIKTFSDWPTIPQLYVDGEFVGGCDILVNMYKEGELEEMVKEKELPTIA